MASLSNKDDVPLVFTWSLTKRIAVLAYMYGVTFNQMVERALERSIF